MKYLIILTLALLACTKKPPVELIPDALEKEIDKKILEFETGPDTQNIDEGAPVEVPDNFAAIMFDLDSFELKAGSDHLFAEKTNFGTLKDVYSYMEANPDAVLLVEGHACELGTEAYNMALSSHRSWSVVDYLLDLGVTRQRVEVKNYGENQPVDGPLYLSRRVEVTVK